MILVKMAAILFLSKFGIQTQLKLSGNDIICSAYQNMIYKLIFKIWLTVLT